MSLDHARLLFAQAIMLSASQAFVGAAHGRALWWRRHQSWKLAAMGRSYKNH